MVHSQIEPGLLQTFRLYIGLRLALAAATIGFAFVRPLLQVESGMVLSLVVLAITFAYLCSSWCQSNLGKWYLPIAFSAATAGPILEVAMGLRHPQLVLLTSAGGPTTDVWQATILLLLPLLFVAWQYDFRAVILFTAGSALLEVAVIIAAEVLWGQQYLIRHMATIAVRSVIFLLEGGVVTQLMVGQRQQRVAVQEANAKLARYAATIEQLATSHERNRLARELHDTLAHTLSVLAVQLEGATSLLSTQPKTAHRMIAQSADLTRNGLSEARRAIHQLRAVPLDDLGFSLALRGLADRKSVV
jgi:signal transduction histidine kinase